MAHVINKSDYTLDTKLLLDEADKLGIKYRFLDREINLIEFSYQGKKRYRKGTYNLDTKIFGLEFSRKDLTYLLLDEHEIPHPQSLVVRSEDDFEKIKDDIEFPCVVKSPEGFGGFGVFTDISKKKELKAKIKSILAKESTALIQEQLTNTDFRLLADQRRVLHTVKRNPARVFGDGKSTVKELVQKENEKPWRGPQLKQELVKINIDKESKIALAKQNLSLSDVPKKDQQVFLKTCCNQCKGGDIETVDAEVHPKFKEMAIKATRLFETPLAGIDIMADDITKDPAEVNGKMIEVNIAPGVQIHQVPTYGKGVNIARMIFQTLFKEEFG